MATNWNEDARRALTLEDCTAIVFTRSRWNEPPRVRHQVTRQLARFCPVVFVETPASGRDRRSEPLERVDDNLYCCSVASPFPIPLRFAPFTPGVHRALQGHVLRTTMGVLGRLGARAIVIVNFDYDFPMATSYRDAALTAYVCNDDFATMARGPLRRAFVTHQERITAAGADVCFAVSHPLVEHVKRLNGNTHLLLPGHDIAILRPVLRSAGPTRAAFMGFINARLDFDWLIAAAKEPDIDLELIGPLESMPAALAELVRTGVVRHVGTLTGTALQQALSKNDVLLMPYDSVRPTGVHAGTVSNKLFAYLAVGKPVVISNLPNFIDLGPGIIYRTRSAAEFIAAIHAARAEDSEVLRAKRQRIAGENTWSIRGDVMKTQLDVALRAGRTRGSRA